MHILVTGGAGFIGSHLVERLLIEGHQVSVVDTFETGQSVNLSKVYTNANLMIYNDSILDKQKLLDISKGVDYIFHLAAAVGVLNVVKHPLKSMITNIRGTENVLEVADHLSIPFFLASSSEVYGKNSSKNLSENADHILGPTTTLRWSYSQSKALDESLAYAYWKEKDLPVRISRFFNTVGPRQRGEFGMVIPRFISAALANEPINIFGTGNQTRCFIHVLDVIDALMAISFSEQTIGEVYNIGNPFSISINDLANKIIKLSNSRSQIIHISYADAYGDNFEDMERRFPNIEKISKFGWSPTRDLDYMLFELINLNRNNTKEE
jgi:UDP-glucose 4-epimerase